MGALLLAHFLAFSILVVISLMSLWNMPTLIRYKMTSSLFPEPTDFSNTFWKVSRVAV